MYVESTNSRTISKEKRKKTSLNFRSLFDSLIPSHMKSYFLTGRVRIYFIHQRLVIHVIDEKKDILYEYPPHN